MDLTVILYALLLSLPVVGLVVAAGVTAVGWRRRPSLPAGVRWTGGAALACVLATALFWIQGADLNLRAVGWDEDRIRLARLVALLAMGCVLVVVLSLPVRRGSAGSIALLERRSVLTFAPRGWLVVFALLVALEVVAARLAGATSGLDELGRYTRYSYAIGNFKVGTTTYGWYFSEPSLVALAVLVLLTVAGMAALALPPFGADAVAERRIREARTRMLLAAATGAVLLHLATVLRILKGAAGVGAQVPTSEAGVIQSVPPFAALGPTFEVLAVVAAVLGYAAWWWPLLQVLTAPSLRAVRAAAT